MADFQKTVNLMPAAGIPGAYASTNPIISTPKGYIAAATVTIGAFVWQDTTYANQVKNTGSGKPLGFAAREVTNPLAMAAVYANSVPAGCPVSVQVCGDFYASPTANSTKGQKVFASTTNGTIKGANAGSSVDGYVETDFVFTESINAGEVGIISNYGNNVVGATTDLSSYQTKAQADAAYVSAVAAGEGAGEVKVTKNGTDTTITIPLS